MGKVYRTEPFVGSCFEPTVPQYFLNHKGNLERAPIDKNVHEHIQSQRSTLFEKILDEMSMGGMTFTEDEKLINESVRHATSLDIMLEADKIIEDYKRENNLPDEMSKKEVYDFINNRIGEIRESIKTPKEENNNEAKNEASKESE